MSLTCNRQMIDCRRVTIQEYLTLVPCYGLRNQNRRPRGFNKGRSARFRVGYRVQQTPEEGQRRYRPKHIGNNNKDEDNSPKTHNDKKYNNCFSLRIVLASNNHEG